MFKGKTALVTGSTSGIGLEIARNFALQGANVVLNGFGDAVEIQKICDALQQEATGTIVYDGADMSKPDQIENMMNAAHEKFEGIDILINNAGVQHMEAVETFPVARWDAIIAINLTAAFHTARLAIPAMKARGWGRIINVASAHALVASPYKSAYVAAKHGIAGFTKTVALELATHNITCNAICPGYVLTPLVEKQIPETAKARGLTEAAVINDVLLAAQPTKKFVQSAEVAALTQFLVSDSAASITGGIYTIDGGWTAQ